MGVAGIGLKWYNAGMKAKKFIVSRAVVAFAVFAACGASAAQFRQIHRIFATEPEKIEAAAKAYPGAFGDGIILATFTNLKLGTPEVRDFAAQKAFVERMKAAGMPVQICVSSTIGHTDDWTEEQGYPKMVGTKGQKAKTIACPRSAEFADNLRGVFRRYAELGPTAVWIDDDFRMAHHPPVDFGCFCDSCVKRFGAETGISLSRKGLVDAILEDKSVDGKSVRREWNAYSSRALVDLVGVIAGAVHEVDPGIVIGIMGCNPAGLVYGPPDFDRFIERAKNRDGVVWFRHGSGAYTDVDPYAKDGIVAKSVAIGRLCAMTERPGVVNFTEEVTCPYDRRAKSMKMTFLEAALEAGLSGANGMTFDAIKPNLDEQLRPDAVLATMCRRGGELSRMASLVEGKRQIGVWPFFSSAVWTKNDKEDRFGKLGSLDMEAWRPLLYIGVPFTFRERDASLLLLSGKSVRAMPRERLDAWLARGVMADGQSAAEVERIVGARPAAEKFGVFGNGVWSRAVWARKESLEVKDALDRLAGGRMPSRVDTCVRLAQSVWKSPDGRERVVFLFNLDFDDATDVVLTEDGAFAAELLNADGSWTALGSGDVFRIPEIRSWSPAVVRLRR